jgi:hypothetical protein
MPQIARFGSFLKQARRWIEEHRAELLAMWHEFQR